jgi:hypothetical protein
MLDVRKPLGLLFLILGALLFLYGQFFSEPVNFQTPHTFFPLKLNQPVGAFMFIFGLVMWQLARYVELHTLDRELTDREKELERVERKRAKALAKQQAAAAEAAGGTAPVDLSETKAAEQSKAQSSEAVDDVDLDEFSEEDDADKSGDGKEGTKNGSDTADGANE